MNLKPIYLLGVIEVILLTILGVWFFHWQDMKKHSISSPPARTVPALPSPSTPPTPETPAPNPHPSDCQHGGCSGQLCTDEPAAMSTCEWSEAYGCYQKAECKRQADGKCGFTQTSELRICLQKATQKASSQTPVSGLGTGSPQPW